MSESDRHQPFVWYDLMTPEPVAVQRFYTELVGWGTTQWEGDQSYTLWTNGDAPLGGLMLLPEDARQAGAPPHWLGYVFAPDLDETAEVVTRLGGTVHHPATRIPNAGAFAIFGDPQGGVFAAYSSEARPEPARVPAVGEFSWHELATTDHEAAFAFYHDAFGWEQTDAMDLGPMGTYLMFGTGGRTLGGMFTKSAELEGPPFWLYYIRVPDVHAATERVATLGGRVLNGPMEVPGGDWVAQCVDPQGAVFALHASKV
jgi:hypothetical protein